LIRSCCRSEYLFKEKLNARVTVPKSNATTCKKSKRSKSTRQAEFPEEIERQTSNTSEGSRKRDNRPSNPQQKAVGPSKQPTKNVGDPMDVDPEPQPAGRSKGSRERGRERGAAAVAEPSITSGPQRPRMRTTSDAQRPPLKKIVIPSRASSSVALTKLSTTSVRIMMCPVDAGDLPATHQVSISCATAPGQARPTSPHFLRGSIVATSAGGC
jgi:hypothetical protein